MKKTYKQKMSFLQYVLDDLRQELNSKSKNRRIEGALFDIKTLKNSLTDLERIIEEEE